MSENFAPIESKTQFADTPQGRQQYWTVEIGAAKDNSKTWWADGEKVIREFLGEKTETKQRLNLFYADTTTKGANMSGIPKVRARRRFADSTDDVARVSADVLERLLNTDIDREEDGYRKSLAMAREDWERPGLGAIRFRYVVETEKVPGTPAQVGPDGVELAPAVPEQDRKTFEDVETDYVHWKDFLWSPCRTWSEVRWVSFRAEMTRDQLRERFGDEKGRKVPIQRRQPKEAEGISEEIRDAWSRAEVWEIWDKQKRERVFFADGMDEILEVANDPLGLPGFFPCPEPLCANLTTSKWLPRPFYFMAEDLYLEAHELTRRIRQIVKGIKNVGGYDSACPEMARILDEAYENQLVPVKNWSLVKEKGGLSAAVELLPIKERVEALIALVEQRNLVKQDLYEITGQSDIMRGQAAQKATATEQRIKARFGSTRIQALQDEFARFASEGQRIRAQIIVKYFDAETIVARSNIDQAETIEQPTPPQMPGAPPGPPQKVPNQELISKAIELLKSNLAAYRIEVDSDSLAMTDFDAVQQESMSFLEGTAKYFAAVGPLAVDPDLASFFAELYQTAISAVRGAQRFEPIVDRFIAKMQEKAAQPPPPPPPDPKVEQEKIKTEAIKMKAQAEQQKGQMDMQGKAMDLQFKQAELGMKAQEMAMDADAKREEMALDREMAIEEHAMSRDQMQMGMEAKAAETRNKMAMLKAKPKGKDK
jgi:hypothetical protein